MVWFFRFAKGKEEEKARRKEKDLCTAHFGVGDSRDVKGAAEVRQREKETERERDRDRKRERQKETEKETERDRERERGKEGETEAESV